MMSVKQYNGALGDFVICDTEDDHCTSIESGKLSCGPDMIEAIQLAKQIFPNAAAIYMGWPGEETEVCESRTSENRIDVERRVRLSGQPATIATPVPQRKRARLWLDAHQIDMIGSYGK